MERMMLFVGLALNATPTEIEALHESIDNFYSRERNGGLSPQELQNITSNNVSTQPAAAVTSTAQPAGDSLIHGDKGYGVTADGRTLDKDGLPWDERIHSSNQKLTDKGMWTNKRNVDDGYRTQIRNALRATLASAGAAPVTTQPAVAAVVATPAAGLPSMPGAGLPGLPGLNQTPALDPAYARLVDAAAKHLNTPANPTGTINDEWLSKVLAHFGIADGNLQNAAHNPQACQQTLDYMASQGLAV